MTNQDRHEWTLERLSEYLDGTLPQAQTREVAAHLASCDACQVVHGDLEAITQAARGLGPLEPPTDLWPGVQQAIHARGGRRGGWGPAAHSRVSRPLLAAAAMVLVAVSASLAWWGRGALTTPSVASTEAAPISAVRPAGMAAGSGLPESMAEELRQLESVVSGVRERLDPGTVEVLERNLLLIERAIEDSYRALAVDPENDFVRQHLERTYQRKIDFLRELSRLSEAAG